MRHPFLAPLALVLCAGALGSGAAFHTLQDQPLERRIPARPGGTLSLDLRTGGEVRVQGWDRDEVWVKADLRGRDRAGTRVEIAGTGGGAQVRAWQQGAPSGYSTSHAFEVRVPRRYDVRISSAGGGLRIADVEGTFTGETRGGELSLERVRGRADLHTLGGGVTVFDSRLSGRVWTGGGEVRLDRVSGGLRTARDVNVEGAGSFGGGPGPVVINTAGGPINVADARNGARLSTGGGAIRVRSAAGRVEATTGAGAVQVDALDGEAVVRTGAGSVTLTLVGDTRRGEHDVDIRSGTGAVTLTIPAGMGATFDVETGYTRAHGRAVRIETDLPLRRSESATFESIARGTARKHVRASGIVGDGRHRIVIRTVNGDVRIRQAP
jgi:DUF4097 and DUF4098 domain-containing protein YvlB